MIYAVGAQLISNPPHPAAVRIWLAASQVREREPWLTSSGLLRKSSQTPASHLVPPKSGRVAGPPRYNSIFLSEPR